MSNGLKIWGILNVTPDSFSDGGDYFNRDSAINAALKLMNDGADVLDIGAESTRPGATLISAQQEWDRLKDILPTIKQEAKKRNVLISLDSSKGQVVQNALEYIDIINDVSALSDHILAHIVKESKLPFVLMHHLTIPASREVVVDSDLDILECILSWMEQKLAAFQEFGIQKEQFILDPGIGFGKTPSQSIEILKQIGRLKRFNLPLLIAHSRKGYLHKAFKANTIYDLDAFTALISLKLLKSEAQNIRVHNVLLHRQFIDIARLI